MSTQTLWPRRWIIGETRCQSSLPFSYSLPWLQSLCAYGNSIISSKIINSDQTKWKVKEPNPETQNKKKTGRIGIPAQNQFLKKNKDKWSTPGTVICPIFYPRGILINPAVAFSVGENFCRDEVSKPPGLQQGFKSWWQTPRFLPITWRCGLGPVSGFGRWLWL